MLLESPLLKDIYEEKERNGRQDTLIEVLEGRFGSVPEDLNARIRSIQDFKTLKQLSLVVSHCTDLEDFKRALPS